MYIRSLGVVNQYKVNQAIPSLQSTSYDYWWPYSAVGDASTSTATSVTIPDLDTNTGSSPSSVPTPSVIRITALPPATTSIQAVLPKLPYHRAVNILYLVPLFVALGVMLGTITAVILLKWRRRLLHSSPLLPGPPYVPAENVVDGRLPFHAHPSMEQVSLLTVSTPSKHTVHGSRYTPKQIPAWKALDTTRSSYSRLAHIHTIIPSSDGERFTVLTQEDPFHLPPNATAVRQSPNPSNDVSFPTIRIIPSLPKPVSGGNPQEQDTALPKPFRRSMFDILKLKGSSASVRKEYTVLASDDEPADNASTSRVHRVTSLKVVPPTGTNRFRSTRSLDGPDVRQSPIDDPTVYPQRSQLVDEGLLHSPTGDAKRRKVTPFAAESRGCRDEIDEGTHPDIYTKAPQRRRSRKKPSRSVARCASVPDMHAAVLPLSPPLLMSPPLERSLFFTTTLSPSASLAAHMNPFIAPDPSPRRAGESPVMSPLPTPSKETMDTRTPRTGRPGSPLPYPSYPDQGHERPAPVHTKRRTGIPSPKGRPTSATHRESTTGITSLGSLSPTSLAIAALAAASSSDMLNKVNDIVAQGYTRRSSVGGSGHAGADI